MSVTMHNPPLIGNIKLARKCDLMLLDSFYALICGTCWGLVSWILEWRTNLTTHTHTSE